MYILDDSNNRIKKAQNPKFKDLHLEERRHLQEWIANEPSCLGEDLLIIQKEFDGFDDTRERLDLLALDKQGNLVIIENKLDDSGRDVTWQAIKYASYCSSLSKQQVIDIYQKYLDGQNKMPLSNFLSSSIIVMIFQNLKLTKATLNELSLLQQNLKKKLHRPSFGYLISGSISNASQ